MGTLGISAPYPLLSSTQRGEEDIEMVKMTEAEEGKQLMQKIAKILDEARSSNATHNRKLKELSALRFSKTSSFSSSFSSLFLSAFSKTLLPLFAFQRRAASAERIVRFVSCFATVRDPDHASDCDAFLEGFLRFLLPATSAANKTARFRACQMLSEVS